MLVGLLTIDPHVRGHQATNWTVPLLHGELQRFGYTLSLRIVRRPCTAWATAGNAPGFVLGRPDPAYAEKKGP